jgi:DNA-binding NarL/FixJ family response regulator
MASKILIVDDHEIVRAGIRTLLEQSRPDWEVCGEAANANDALVAVKNLKPDVVILDITMPGTSGLVAAQRMSKLGVSSRILIFTMHESERLEGEVRDAGAHGYVLKSQAARDLIVAIQSLLGGGTFFRSSSRSVAPGDEEPGPGIIFFKAPAWLVPLRC